jgi:hypothetical protein
MSIIGSESENNPGPDEHSPDRANRPEVVKPVPLPRTGRHRAEDTCWLGLAGRVLQSWPMTLRLAVLVMLVVAMAVIAMALGFVHP